MINKLWQKPQAGPGRNTLFQKRGKLRSLLKQVHWRKLGAQSLAASHWLSGDSLSLAGLLLGCRKAFPPPSGLVRENQSANSFFLLGLQLSMRGRTGDGYPYWWPPDSVLVRFPVINFNPAVASARAGLFVLLTKSKYCFLFILYPQTLINSLILGMLLQMSWDFLHAQSCHGLIELERHSFLSDLCTLHFSFLPYCSGYNFGHQLVKVVRAAILALFLILGWKHPSTTLAVGFLFLVCLFVFKILLIKQRKFPSITIFQRVVVVFKS